MCLASTEGNVTDLQGITTLDTSLIIGEGTGQAMPFLRGVGTLPRGVGNEASTSIYWVLRSGRSFRPATSSRRLGSGRQSLATH
jgi:hypothetical protein